MGWLLDTLARAVARLRTLGPRVRVVSPENLLWAVILLVALLFVLTLFTFSRAIAP